MRTVRLAAPAVAFVIVGFLLLVLAPDLEARVRGGLPTLAGYALAIQVVLGLLLLVVIDDMRDMAMSRATDAGLDLRRAVARFYRRHPLAALFLAAGLALSLSVMGIGLFDRQWNNFTLGTLFVRPSEVALAVVLLVTALVQLRRADNGFFGWCVGFALGAAVAQLELNAGDVFPTLSTWGGYAAGLCVLGMLVRLIMHQRRG